MFSKDIKENKIEIWILFISAVLIVIFQLGLSYQILNPIIKIDDITDFNSKLSLALNLVPIVLSSYLCKRYWGKLVKDIENNNFDSIYPTLMVAQGTFYTFVGVSAILVAYKANGGSNEIPLLIGGLKLAFLTSVIGILFSIGAKSYIKEKMDIYVKNKEHIDEYNIYDVLKEISCTLKDIKEQSDRTNKDVKQNIENLAVKNEESLKECGKQIKLLLDDSFSKMADNVSKINDELNKTKTNMAQINLSSQNFRNKLSKAYIELGAHIDKLDEKYASHLNKLDERHTNYLNKLDEGYTSYSLC